MNRTLLHRKGGAGFTLVEMLVSVAVLVLIMTFIAQMMNSTSISTTLSGKHLDADAEARLVFDRMSFDFARMSRRTDVDFDFVKQPDYDQLLTTTGTIGVNTSGTVPQMFFYSEAPAYAVSDLSGANDNSSVALIGYTVNTTGTASVPAYSLQRLSKGLTLNTSPNDASAGSGTSQSMVFLTFPGPNTSPLPASTLQYSEGGVIGEYPDPPVDTSDYDLLSPEVLRMDFCFQVKDLSNPYSPGTVYSNYPVAFFSSNAANKRYIEKAPPTQTAVTGPHPAVGDRWYDTLDNRSYVCTSLLSTGTTATPLTYPTWTPNGLADVKAIVVAIAILDQGSRKVILQNPLSLPAIADTFWCPTEGGLNPKAEGNSTIATAPQLMADLWQNELTTNLDTWRSTNTSLATAASQVRIYQRFFYLNNN